ncbi:MAG: protein kinase domain-containing protein [Gemmataceae bacterium]
MRTTPCPDPVELRKLVQGTLAPETQAELESHLGGCARCQAALERLSAMQPSWGDMAGQLGRPAAVDPALGDVMERLRAEPPGATAADHLTESDQRLDFLDPPEKPGQLGKLAHYEVLELIGRGGMGIVLKAFDPRLHRIVAIKVMAPQLAADVTGRKRFLREAQAVAAVSHEHIVTIYAVEETKGTPYLVMQYIAGRSLQQRIDEGGALEVKEILRIGMQTANGLAAAHAQGLVHRDVKPANILLENGIERVKITDFGLARAVDGARVTRTGVVTGSPQYMAPEQARGESVDGRADLFSLGAVTYAMCTGYAPFRASSSMAVLKKVCDEAPRAIAELNPEIPDWLIAIVEKLMAKDPKERFQTAAEVASLLGQHLAHLQQPAVFPQPSQIARQFSYNSQPPARSWAMPIVLILAPIILMVVLAAALSILELDFHTNRIAFAMAILLGGLSVAVGVILVIVQLAKRTAGPLQHPPAIARPAAPATAKGRLSQSWILAGVVGVACLLLLPCLIVPLGLGGWVLLSPHPDGNHGSVEGQNSLGVTDPPPASGMRDSGRAAQNPNPHPLPPQAPSRERMLEVLHWFPQESTFFGVIDFTPFGSLTIDSPLVQTLLDKLAPPPARAAFDHDNFAGTRLDRVSFALVENASKRGETRMYVRLSGQFNRTRMTRFLLERIKDATAKPGAGVGQDNVTLISSPTDPPAIALVGETDVLLAGYPNDGKNNRDPQLIQQALELRLYAEGAPPWVKPNLTAGSYEKELNSLPGKSFAVVMGDLPETLRKAALGDGKSPMRSLPRFVSLTAAREPSSLRFESRLPGPKEATMFAEDLDKQLVEGSASLKKLPQEALAAGLAQGLGAAKLVASGNKVTIDLNLPEDALGALVAAVKMLPSMAGTSEVVRPVHEVVRPVQMLKKFDPKTDKPITSEIGGRKVTVEGDEWKIEKSGTPELGSENNTPRVRLFELIHSPGVQGRLFLRFKARTEKVNPAFLELRTQWIGDHGQEAKSKQILGSTNWTDYEVALNIGRPTNEERVTISVDLLVQKDLRDNAIVWLKDVELVKIEAK